MGWEVVTRGYCHRWAVLSTLLTVPENLTWNFASCSTRCCSCSSSSLAAPAVLLLPGSRWSMRDTVVPDPLQEGSRMTPFTCRVTHGRVSTDRVWAWGWVDGWVGGWGWGVGVGVGVGGGGRKAVQRCGTRRGPRGQRGDKPFLTGSGCTTR